jgi:DNA-binding CsgD family transcriptional regulator/membrane protein implicated in regulation of membrane protease activity
VAWVVWIVIGVTALLGELLTLGLYFGSFALAAFITAGVATTEPMTIQIAVFAVLTVLFLAGVRPLVSRFLPAQGAPEFEPRIGPVGQSGVVTRQVDSRRGQIQVGQAEFWSARLAAAGPPVAVGREVHVTGMDGLAALVEPVGQPDLTQEGAPYGLSAREVEVLQLIALGRSNQEIADVLVVSPRTVHHHVSHILTKMGVDSRVDAARIAIRRGLVPAEDDLP